MSSRRNSSPVPRIPEEYNGIQVNFCKNPQCSYYGVPASTKEQPRGPGAKERGRDPYTISGGNRKKGEPNVPVLVCPDCGEYPPIKNNAGIYDEKARFMAYIVGNEASCPVAACKNHEVPVSQKKGNYHSIGETKVGSPRYKCLACNKTFSVSALRPASRHLLPHKNSEVYNMLVNGVAMRRICKIAGINHKTLYDKIRFIHKQVLAFAAHRERKLFNGELQLEKLYLSVDRQDHMINWNNRGDKRQTQFQAIGTADNKSSYVFAIHLNYDPEMNPGIVEAETLTNGDYAKSTPLREHARLWLQGDYKPAIALKAKELSLKDTLGGDDPGLSLEAQILQTYNLLTTRKDVESFDLPAEYNSLPTTGMQVHAEYSLYGHFFFLRDMFAHVPKIRFFLDQESGIRAACLAAFQDRILAHECAAFYVKINKGLNNDQKNKAMRDVRLAIEDLGAKYPVEISFHDLRRMLIAEAIKTKGKRIGPWHDNWVPVLSRIKSEPEKQVCLLTDFNNYDDDHLAALMDLASLHGIDRFFAQVRNSISLLGRSTSSASNVGRRWYQKNPYNPQVAAMVLDIYRVHYNYLEVGDDKCTPAMRLGLAKGPIRLTDILGYS